MNCKYYARLLQPIYVGDKPIYDYCQKHCNECTDCTKIWLDKLVELSQEAGLYDEQTEVEDIISKDR